MADFQEAQVTFRMRMRERELSLRERAREMGYELDRLSIDHKAAIEQAAIEGLERADTARSDFTRRGQTFAMWLAGGTTIALLAGGLTCIFLTVAGAVAGSVGLPAAGILLAAGLFAGIANLIRNFLPRN